MKWIIYILLAAGLVVINQTVFGLFDFGGFVPNLLMLFTFGMIMSFEGWDFLVLVCIGGVWLELVSGLPLGSMVLGLLILSLVTLWILKQWLLGSKQWWHFLGIILLGSVFINLWLFLYSSIVNYLGWHWLAIDASVILAVIIPSTIANLVLAYPVFILVEFIAGVIARWSRHKTLA